MRISTALPKSVRRRPQAQTGSAAVVAGMERRGVGCNDGHDTRSLQAYLGHRNIQNTTRYTAASAASI